MKGLITVHPTLSVIERVPDTLVSGTIRKIQIEDQPYKLLTNLNLGFDSTISLSY